MSEYLVTWEIQLDADSPEGAAQRALEAQRDPDSIATVFGVTDTTGVSWTVDLAQGETRRLAPHQTGKARTPEPPIGAVIERSWPDGSSARFHRSLLIGDPPGARWSLDLATETQWWTWDEILADGEPTVRVVPS